MYKAITFAHTFGWFAGREGEEGMNMYVQAAEVDGPSPGNVTVIVIAVVHLCLLFLVARACLFRSHFFLSFLPFIHSLRSSTLFISPRILLRNKQTF